MLQDDFDLEFYNKYPNQPATQSYMRKEIKWIKSAFAKKGIVATMRQAKIFWESYCNSMDGDWLSSSKDHVDKIVKGFLADPKKWWELPYYVELKSNDIS